MALSEKWKSTVDDAITNRDWDAYDDLIRRELKDYGTRFGIRLYVWCDLRVDGASSEGNELTFTDHGRQVTLTHVEANDVAAPPGRQAPTQ